LKLSPNTLTLSIHALQVEPHAPFVIITIATILVVIFGGIFMQICGGAGVLVQADEEADAAYAEYVSNSSRRSGSVVEDYLRRKASDGGGGSDGPFVMPEKMNTIGENMWVAWQFLNDGAAHVDEPQGATRFSGWVISIAGIMVMSILTGFIIDFVMAVMEELRKGKSKVCEKDHCVILGWSEKIIDIMVEICSACEGMPDGTSGSCITILADTQEKSYMEEVIMDRFPPEVAKNSRFVVRHGSAMVASDLQKVAITDARAIVILCDESGEADRADAAVLRVVLCVTAELDKSESGAHIVAEIRDVDSSRLLELVGGDRIQTVVSHDIIGRLMINSVRQPGLAKVYEQLLGFEGDEFYVGPHPEATGCLFGDLGERFPGAIVLGIVTTDDVVVLKPSMTRPVLEGEEIIVVAEDDDTFEYVPSGKCTCPQGPGPQAEKEVKEKMLICGWRRDVRDMIMLIDDLSTKGSELHIFCALSEDERNDALTDSGFDDSKLTSIKLIHHEGWQRRHMDTLPLTEYTSCLIVADEAKEDDPLSSDSQCLSTLLLVRDCMLKAYGMDPKSPEDIESIKSKVPILTEILDARTTETVAEAPSLTQLSDFVQSAAMVSRGIAMVEEEDSVNAILNELLGGEGQALEVLPASLYVRENEKLSFMQLSKRVHDHDAVCLGYQTQPAMTVEDTVMNPRDKERAKTWDGLFLIIMRGDPKWPELHDTTGDGSSPIGIGMTMGAV